MTVRAKFIVSTITRSRQNLYDQNSRASGVKEVHSIKLFPVTGGYEASEEDQQFWASSPSGMIELNTVNPKAVEEFAANLGQAVYVDFTAAPVDGQ